MLVVTSNNGKLIIQLEWPNGQHAITQSNVLSGVQVTIFCISTN